MTRQSISKIDLYTMLLLGQCAVHSAPKVFLGLWRDYCVVPQQRPYNFWVNLDHSVLAASVVLPWVFRHQSCCGCNAGFRGEMVELWNINIWQVTILTEAYLNLLQNYVFLVCLHPKILVSQLYSHSPTGEPGPCRCLKYSEMGRSPGIIKLQLILFLIPSNTWYSHGFCRVCMHPRDLGSTHNGPRQ